MPNRSQGAPDAHGSGCYSAAHQSAKVERFEARAFGGDGERMLQATFLGHQGWLLSTSHTRVFVDPLLTEGFGHGGLAGRVHPPRRFDMPRMPAIDAVWLTHEHDDHFDLPSLCSLARSIPIYASSRSSVALHGVLADLGFTVHPVGPDAVVPIGDLTLRTFVADHRATPLADEWDVLPLLATDADGQGAFASSVDVAMPDRLLEVLASMPERAWVLGLANNTTDVRFADDLATRIEPSDDTDALAAVLHRRIARASTEAGTPAHVAITGGGWSHHDGWIDRVAFCIDPDRLAAALAESSQARVSAVRPGDTIALDGSEARVHRATWLQAHPDARPAPAAVEPPTVIVPACGRRRLSGDGRERLEYGLRELARYLYARPPFVAAHSQSMRHPFGVWLHDEAGELVYAWTPTAGCFERVDTDDARSAFASGLRLWATDLLALFEGELGASAVCYTGRLRYWNHEPDRLRVGPQLLWTFAHPLHRPEIARRLYGRIVAGSCGLQ